MRHYDMKKITLLALAALLVVGGMCSWSVRTASAKGGNVQIRVYSLNSKSKLSYVKVEGNNQNNRFSSWEVSPRPAASEVKTNNWWWNGGLKYITVYFDTGERYACSTFTSNQFWSDWESIGIGSNGTITASGPGGRCVKL